MELVRDVDSYVERGVVEGALGALQRVDDAFAVLGGNPRTFYGDSGVLRKPFERGG